MLRTIYLRQDRVPFARDVIKRRGLVLRESVELDDSTRITVSGDKGAMSELEAMTSEFWLPPKTGRQKKR